jgi:spore germination protein GerM
VLLALLIGGFVITSRWIDGDRDPVEIDAADVPFSLLRDSVAGKADRVPAGDEARATLFFVYQTALVPVERSVADDATPLDVVASLLEGPTNDEIAAELTGLLIPEGAPERVTIEGSRAVVDLREPIQDSSAGDRRDLAIAQLVYTLTALPDVREVKFLLDGEPVEVPLADGTLTRGAVTRADYPVQVLSSVP